jgi:predicted HicB family RNase H-like nuclease
MVVKKKKDFEFNREKFISKGGQGPKDPKEATMICLRIPNELLEEINLTMEKRVGLSRNAWILEAIQSNMKEQ